MFVTDLDKKLTDWARRMHRARNNPDGLTDDMREQVIEQLKKEYDALKASAPPEYQSMFERPPSKKIDQTRVSAVLVPKYKSWTPSQGYVSPLTDVLFGDDGFGVDKGECIANAWIPWLRRRRYSPFEESGMLMERVLRCHIDKRRDAFVEEESGVSVRAFEHWKKFVGWRFEQGQYPWEYLETLLSQSEERRGDSWTVEKIMLWLKQERARAGSETGFTEETIEYMRRIQFVAREFLRHSSLLPEQRAAYRLLRALSAQESAEAQREISHWFLGDDKNILPLRLLWAEAWSSALLPLHERVPKLVDWKEWYGCVHRVLHDAELFERGKRYAWELSELLWILPANPVLKFLGGATYCTIAERCGDVFVRRDLEKLLTDFAIAQNMFRREEFVSLRPGKSAGRFRVDENAWLVFKNASGEEALLLQSLTSIARDPSAVYDRAIAGMQLWNTPESTAKAAVVIPELLRSAQNDPLIRSFAELKCVHPGGIVVPLGDGRVMLSMLNAGDVLADKVSKISPEKKQELYGSALEMIAKLHFVGTDNTVRVENVFYLSSCPPLYKEQPPLPAIWPGLLLARRLKDRLGDTETLHKLWWHVEQTCDYLATMFQGVIHLDGDETNFASDCLLDVNPRWGSFAFDVARVLYGGSVALKEGVDLVKIRDQYVQRMVSTAKLLNITTREEATMPEIQKWYALARSRDAYFSVMHRSWKRQTRRVNILEGTPEWSVDIVEALASRPAMLSAVDWDFCRESSARELCEHIQAAGILVTMGEVGSYVGQLSRFDEETPEWLHAREELMFAVGSSMMLMRNQGYEELYTGWKKYLLESGKIDRKDFSPINGRFEKLYIRDLRNRVVQGATNSDLNNHWDVDPAVLQDVLGHITKVRGF